MAIKLRPILNNTEPFRVKDGNLEVKIDGTFINVYDSTKTTPSDLIDKNGKLINMNLVSNYVKKLCYQNIINKYLLNGEKSLTIGPRDPNQDYEIRRDDEVYPVFMRMLDNDRHLWVSAVNQANTNLQSLEDISDLSDEDYEPINLIKSLNISDYVSLGTKVEKSEASEPIVISLDYIFYSYDQLYYLDDSRIFDIGNREHELAYELDAESESYAPITKDGAAIELRIEVRHNNPSDTGESFTRSVFRTILRVMEDTNSDEGSIIPSISEIMNLIRIEITNSSIVIYPLTTDITEFRVLTCRLIK